MIACLLTDDEWGQLVQRVRAGDEKLTMPCCEAIAWPRAKPSRHFYHRRRPEDCAYVHESIEHIELKAEVVSVFDELGWRARSEVRGDGWIADVLAEKGDRRVVFEIQLSSQDEDTTIARWERYQEAGLASVWLMRRVPDGLKWGSVSIPAFKLTRHSVYTAFDVEGAMVGLRELIVALVDRRLRFTTPEPTGNAIIRVHRRLDVCRGCGRTLSSVGTSIDRRCVCGNVPVDTPCTADVQKLLDEGVQMAIESNKLVEWADAPFAFDGCPNCGARKIYLPNRWADDTVLMLEAELPPVPDADLSTRRHWCLRRG